MTNTAIILIHPQMGENIGAAARVMKNFGLNDLRIVAPRDGWPNEKARSMSVGAVDLVDSATLYDTLQEAIADLHFVYATTAVMRDMHKSCILSQDLKTDIASLPESSKIGIMFGRENCGLNNEEITFANKILTIKTTEFDSLNLAQAIAVIAYELSSSLPTKDCSNEQTLATKEEVHLFFEHLITALDDKHFFKVAAKRPQMVRNLRNIFSRMEGLSKTEVQTFRGIINALS